MATVVKLHVFPDSFNQHRTRLLRRGFGPSSSPGVLGFGHNCEGFSVKQCRAFRTEDGGDLKEKKFRNLKKNEVNCKRESGFWNSLKSIMLRNFMLGSKSDDEYRQAVVKVEEVLSFVSCLCYIHHLISACMFHHMVIISYISFSVLNSFLRYIIR